MKKTNDYEAGDGLLKRKERVVNALK